MEVKEGRPSEYDEMVLPDGFVDQLSDERCRQFWGLVIEVDQTFSWVMNELAIARDHLDADGKRMFDALVDLDVDAITLLQRITGAAQRS
ncbi:hypothetical protein [Albimonas pacifica]|nr:hypothetical protein [Albimonas pacifica]